MEPNHSETEPNPSTDFENRVRALAPSSANKSLKQRLEQSLGSLDEPKSGKPWLIVSALAAAIVIAFVFFASDQNNVEPPKIAQQFGEQIGRQQLVVESSTPIFVNMPDAAPMWQIDMKLMNREFIETPEGVLITQFEPEDRTVFVPVIYQ